MKTTDVYKLNNDEIRVRLFGSKTAQKLYEYKSMSELKQASHEDLLLSGLTLKEADVIYLTFEASRRAALEGVEKLRVIKSADDAAAIFQEVLQDSSFEQFWVMYLNKANAVIRVHCMSSGGITGTVVDVRLILKRALSVGAVQLILCHNHPSGSLQASGADKNLTIKIKEAAGYMDIKLVDHLIVSKQGFFSFLEAGMID